MKNKYLIILLLALVLSSCTIADDYSFTITVTNYSTTPVDNIMIGNIFIGTVFTGQTVTYKYFQIQENAKIDVKGFQPTNINLYSGIMDLRLGYNYKLSLYTNKTFFMNGTKVRDSSSIFME